MYVCMYVWMYGWVLETSWAASRSQGFVFAFLAAAFCEPLLNALGQPPEVDLAVSITLFFFGGGGWYL